MSKPDALGHRFDPDQFAQNKRVAAGLPRGITELSGINSELISLVTAGLPVIQREFEEVMAQLQPRELTFVNAVVGGHISGQDYEKHMGGYSADSRRRLSKLFNVLIVLSFILASCAPNSPDIITSTPPVAAYVEPTVSEIPVNPPTHEAITAASSIELNVDHAAELVTKDLNYKLEFESIGNTELIDKVDQQFVIRAKEGAQLILIPIQKDLFIDKNRSIRELSLSGGEILKINEVGIIRDSSGHVFQLGVVAGNYGDQVAGFVVLDSGSDHFDKESMSFASPASNILSTVTYMAGEKIYPNKVFNVLQAMLQITNYQLKNGPFNPGETYSVITMMGLNDSLRSYLDGKTSSGSIVPGGGVCAVATAVSSALYEAFPEFVPIEQWEHPLKYFQGPFSEDAKKVDATVEITNSGKSYDFSWKQPGDRPLYLHFHATLVPNGKNGHDPFGPSDVDVVITVSLSTDPPTGQANDLSDIMAQYSNFRAGKKSHITDNEFKTYDWSESIRHAIHLLYGFEDFSAFVGENEALISNVLELRDVLNNIPDEAKISDYIKTTKWYINWVAQHGDSSQLDATLRMLDYGDHVDGQRVQCVGFSILASVAYPELVIKYIGGASVSFAKQLVPPEVSSGASRVGVPEFGGLAIGRAKIDDFVAGDLFVLTDTKTGHVGVVLGKTVVNGETILLIADANRHADGKVNVFTVSKNNFFEVFGDNVNIIRSAKK